MTNLLPPDTQRHTPGARRLSAARVLIVDDGVEHRQLSRLLLEKVGVEVDEAENGRQGIQLALAGRYDVILMDVQMPEMDGLEAAAALRAAGLDTPIVALTANAGHRFQEECLAAGCTAHLAKPIDADALRRTLARHLEESGASAPIRRVAQEGMVISTRERRALRALAEQFVTRLGERLDLMVAALDAGDLEELARFAHWVKGTGGGVGFDQLHALASALEIHARAGDVARARQTLETLRAMYPRLQVEPAASRTEVGAPTCR